jgi:glutathione S-transferase
MRDALSASGGPFLFGTFGIVDAMYFPVLTRFATYDVALPMDLQAYADAMKASPAVTRWRELARRAPAIPIYDGYIREKGGEIHVPGGQAGDA